MPNKIKALDKILSITPVQDGEYTYNTAKNNDIFSEHMDPYLVAAIQELHEIIPTIEFIKKLDGDAKAEAIVSAKNGITQWVNDNFVPFQVFNKKMSEIKQKGLKIIMTCKNMICDQLNTDQPFSGASILLNDQILNIQSSNNMKFLCEEVGAVYKIGLNLSAVNTKNWEPGAKLVNVIPCKIVTGNGNDYGLYGTLKSGIMSQQDGITFNCEVILHIKKSGVSFQPALYSFTGMAVEFTGITYTIEKL